MRIYLVRHGMPVGAEKGRRYLGITDEHLCSEGMEQARKTGLLLSQLEPETNIKIFASTLQRSIETAKIINEYINSEGIAIEGGLREIDLGEWDGRYAEDVSREFPEEYKARGENLWDHRIPGGETFAETGERFKDALNEIVKQSADNEAIIVVSHAGAINAGLSLMTGLQFEDVRALRIPYAGVIAVCGAAGESGDLALTIDKTYF